MKIKDIQIDGFGVWTGLSVDSMNEGMTLFYGPNEAGKTTLMQFLRAMLYGFTPERSTRYLPPVYGGTPGGAIRVTGPGGGYEVRRHSQLTDHTSSGTLTVTGADGLSQGQHRLSGLLGGIDESIFSNVFAIGIRELQELSTLDDTSAADELYKLSSGLDRVSLVDVLRSLRAGRGELVGRGAATQDEEDAAAGKLAGMMSKREKLRDEIQRLSGQTRRWSELATQRRTQSQEIESLRSRMVAWEREARCVEIATSVFDPWQEREQIREQIADIENEASLPDEAPSQLVQIDVMIEERRGKVEEIKNRRRGLRDKAEQLPVNKRLFDLQGRIEAATQQATWVEALEEQISRIDVQIEKARKQVEVDADRLGIDEGEREMLAQGESGELPDFSRQTLSVLTGPAKNVKEQMFLLKQARSEGKNHKVRAEKHGERLQELLRRAHADDVPQAIRRERENIASLRHRIQLSQHLEKLIRQHRDLEQESIELTTDEALPIDRLFVLGLPFIFGGMLVLYGLFNVFQITTFVGQPNPTQGMMCILFGAMALLVYYLSRERGQRSAVLDLEDCERQIDSVRRQIREVESERSDVDSSSHHSKESLEAQLREADQLLGELEEAEPVHLSHMAAEQSYKASYQRATKAADGLKTARREWTATLDRLGLSTTLSPKSVRSLGDGYETLQSSIRRLNDLREEREQRRKERQTIAKRIESLYIESIDASDDSEKSEEYYEPERSSSAPQSRKQKNGSRDKSSGSRDKKAAYRTHGSNGYEDDYQDVDVEAYDNEYDDEVDSRSRMPRQGSNKIQNLLKSRSNPLDQLNHLHEELARQQHWIKQRRDLKRQDAQYKKQQSMHSQAIERGEQQRRALWAKCGVATAEQFYQLVDRKSQLAQYRKNFEDLDKQIRTMIGSSVNYDDVAREIEGVKATDLERRWDSLTTRMSETEARVAGLQTAQGELAASMKQLGDDDRLMTARLELGCVERQLNQLARRWQTLATASCLLEDVCGTVENERQPETLREASSFLNQLTDGKYNRIWTPLGSNQLKIDDSHGKSLPLEVLSRGTGEAVFIALRLSLAAAYSRRGVMLPLILDDVLVNFDGARADHAARTLQTFAELGHQVMMFTCHDHIVDIFHNIGVEVREMPAQGTPGRAHILAPPEEYPEETYEEAYVEEEEYEEPEVEEVAEIQEPEPEPEPEPVMIEPVVIQPEPVARPAALVVENRRVVPSRPKPPKSKYHFAFQRLHRQHRQKRRPQIKIERHVEPERKPVRIPKVVEERRPVEVVETHEVEDAIGWAWFQREPADGRIDAEEAAAQAARNQWLSEEDRNYEQEVETAAGADHSWWKHEAS
ncbi:AAA family ATPase [Neorhodopirellula lusitana]|uniref:AAA family ATPase n=1 Tax=Neorhodopirellula lusitana TaxID=445327 RepID=UPI00384E61D1